MKNSGYFWLLMRWRRIRLPNGPPRIHVLALNRYFFYMAREIVMNAHTLCKPDYKLALRLTRQAIHLSRADVVTALLYDTKAQIYLSLRKKCAKPLRRKKMLSKQYRSRPTRLWIICGRLSIPGYSSFPTIRADLLTSR